MDRLSLSIRMQSLRAKPLLSAKKPSWKETREMKSKVCNPDHCNFPGKTVPAMEACGIDVFATVRANGLEIHTLRDPGEVQNHFGLVLVE